MRLTKTIHTFGKGRLLKAYNENLHPSVTKSILFQKPLMVSKGDMQWIYDIEGKKYLDLFGGIVTVGVGHCHPKVNDALIQQAKKIWHTSALYLTEPTARYCEKLASTFPGNLKVVYPVVSGSEANDLALTMARAYTGNFDVIALRNAYHGGTPTSMTLCGLSSWKQLVPQSPGIHHAMNPNVYRGLFGGNKCRDSPVQADRKCNCECKEGKCGATEKYAEQLKELFDYSLPQKKAAAMFMESIQGVGGIVQYPKGYVEKAAQIVRENGGLIVSDEVQTGFGRTGDHMWHFQDHNIVPDIVTLAKSIGNGFPMAAVVTTPEIARCMENANHFATYGGNPLAGAVGSAVLEVIEEEKLQENCKINGTYFLQQLDGIKSKFPFVGDVRGKGLMIGVELVRSKETKEPLPVQHIAFLLECIKDHGVLAGKGGFYGNVLRIAPPMILTKEDINFSLDIIQKCFELYKKNMFS